MAVPTSSHISLPSPPEVRAAFSARMAQDPEEAVAYLYGLEVSCGYIKTEAIARNIRWTAASPYGQLECTINLSKPEKDPRAIAAEASPDTTLPSTPPAPAPSAPPSSPSIASSKIHSSAPSDARHATQDESINHCAPEEGSAQNVPQCDLCWENEGFPGTPEHPAKPGLRIAAITLGGECWGLQYSPYAYFTEHCIALSRKHRPMKIDEAGIERLLDFIDLFPFYFIGSNADLPIVGGSILSHDHFQGGRHEFPLMKAPTERTVFLEGFPEVQCGIVKWPASVLRLRSENRSALAQAASRILNAWRTFSDEACDIVAADTAQHNTLNPIVRKVGYLYIMDLVLRNNRTDVAHPWGIFHPDESMHHIKKENIGLIEIMGLAILPPRLATELPLVQHELIEAARQNLPPATLKTRLESQTATAPHATWATDIYLRRTAELSAPAAQASEPPAIPPVNHACDLHPIIQQEIAHVFTSILETTGVFKHNEEGAAGWNSLLNKLNGS